MPAIDKARLYRGKGGEVMREAVSRLVSACSAVGLPLAKAQHAKVQEALDENLRHPHDNIQRAAVPAMHGYSRLVHVSWGWGGGLCAGGLCAGPWLLVTWCCFHHVIVTFVLVDSWYSGCADMGVCGRGCVFWRSTHSM